MWKLIDNFCADDKGDTFRTYASQIGTVGCLVAIVGNGTISSPTFVPGVRLEKLDSVDHYQLITVSGYGEVPTPFT